MKQLKIYTIIGILFVLITGSLAHFLYEWTGNNFIIGLVAPVNESVWEHMKLLFFPMLLYSFFAGPKLKTNYPYLHSSLCFGNLLGTSLIPIFFYGYHFILKKDLFILDISLYILSVVIAFIAACRLALSYKRKSYRLLLYGLVAILFICFALFSYYPLDLEIFHVPK